MILPIKIAQIKSVSSIPVVAGFGISTKKVASLVLDSADGFVVGSFFVKAISEGKLPSQLHELALNLDPREVKIV